MTEWQTDGDGECDVDGECRGVDDEVRRELGD